MAFQLRIQSIESPAGGAEDGPSLVQLVRDALERGPAPAAAVVRRPRTIDLIYLRELRDVNPARLLAALTRSRIDGGPEPEGVGLIGQFSAAPREGVPRPAPWVQVFLEWPDNAWWHWRALLGADGRIDPTTVTEHSATLGDPLPAGLGRWWSTGRRERMSLDLHRDPVAPTTDWVH